jgi:hypothetical protein
MDDRKNRALLVAKGNKLIKDLNVVESAMKKARANYVDRSSLLTFLSFYNRFLNYLLVRKTQDKSAQALDKAKQTADPKKEGAAQKNYEKDENKAEKADNEYGFHCFHT